LGALFYFLFFSPFFQIKEIQTVNVNFSKKEEIEKKIEERIETKFFFFKTKSIFLFKKANLKKELLAQFPPILDLEITKKLPKTISVRLIEKKPIAVGFFDDNYFFIDEQGIAFKQSKTEFIPKALPLIYYNNELEMGQKWVQKNELQAIVEINKMLAQKTGLEQEYYLIQDDRIELFLANNSFVLYFSAEKNINRQLDDLALILQERVNKGESIEYIDLRFDQIFIK